MPKSRIEAFSDGVFAIVITLLVLEIKVPNLPAPVSEAALLRALAADLPFVVSCVVSFIIIAIFWVAHHQFWQGVHHANWPLLWLNNLLLLFIVFIPIPTAMIGTYPTLKTPAVIYGGVMTGAGLSFLAMRYYASYAAGLIEVGRAERRRALIRSGFSPILNFLGMILALWSPYIAFAAYVLVPVIYFLRPPSGRGAR